MEGRPKNGMFIALPINLKRFTKDISPSNSRIQAIVLNTENKNLMIINVYFPNDPKTVEYNNDPDLEDVFADIENLIDTHHCNDVIITGDLNIDFERMNGHSKRLENFLASKNLESAWKRFNVDYTHEFEINEVTHTSTIDHVIWNECFFKNVISTGVLHLPGNTSDHSPIFCNIKNNYLKATDESGNLRSYDNGLNLRNLKPVDWQGYATTLERKLRDVDVPQCVKCTNVHCRDANHIAEIDDYATNILECVDNCIKNIARKKANTRKSKVVPGWNDEVKPFREKAMFWNAIWISAGKPINTTLHHIMKRSRNLYHYQIRKCRRSVHLIQRNKLLDACVNDNGNIFHELRKMRRVNNSVPQAMDGCKNVSEKFANVYEELYNSANDEEGTAKLLDEVNDCINDSSLSDVNLVTADIVQKAIEEIKLNKNDPVFAFNSNCLKCAPPVLLQHLSNMIKSFLIHGHISKIILIAILVPLLKDKLGDAESSDNYRSIALSSIILKVFDWIVILIFGKSLGMDDLQFSYQRDCSTTMCTWLVVESVSYFLRNDNEVFSCFMDMRKAFDTVKHSLLFKKLIDRNLSPIFLRLLITMYISQMATVRWESNLSHSFCITNGIKQGAVLSAILFCVYIDDLIKQLRRNRTGCWVNGDFVGVIVYADDIVLLSPTIDGLQEMVSTCQQYAKSHNLSFSTHDNPKKSKTKCMAFLKKKRTLRNITLADKKLPWISSIKHLGTTITDDLNMNRDALEKRAQYVAKNNELMQEFHYAHPTTKVMVNNIFNTHFYGSPLWDLFSPSFVKLQKTWNVSHRIMFSLPRETHKYLIEPLSGQTHIVFSIWKRFIKFIRNITKSTKSVLRNIFRLVKFDCRSVTGRNLRNVMLSSKQDVYNEADLKLDLTKMIYCKIPDNELWRVSLIQDILDVKSGKMKLENFSNEELETINRLACCT